MPNNKLIELTAIETIDRNSPDDVLIMTGSPEERCLGIANKLANNYKAKRVMLLKYSHKNDQRESNLEKMRHILSRCGLIDEIVIDEEAPLLAINQLICKVNETADGDKSKLKIAIDVSTLIKWHLLVLLKALDANGVLGNCRLLYTEPEEYITDLFQPLSFGVKEIFPIPLYSGNLDLGKECLLAIMLGYEGDRAMALLDIIDPAECVLLVPKPAYHPEWEGRTEEMNKEIINVVGGGCIEYIDSRNPNEVSKQLEDILSRDKYAKYNCLMSPLGTKPQTIGLYLYWAMHPSTTTLVYSAPLRHNDLFYSKGIGRTWGLPIT